MTRLSDQARSLRDRARALKSAPILTRMTEAAALADQLAEFVVQMAAAVDNLTPYVDEQEAGAGDTETLCNVTDKLAGEGAHGEP